jgi:hypothetical protein
MKYEAAAVAAYQSAKENDGISLAAKSGGNESGSPRKWRRKWRKPESEKAKIWRKMKAKASAK